MKNIIELLYYGQINEAERSDKPNLHIKKPDKEDKAYDLLYKSLSDEQKELFNKWEELYADRLEERVESKFARGLKIGFQLAIQIADLDI